MAFEDDFLAELDSRTWRTPEGAPRSIVPAALFLGTGDHALEVALATAGGRPKSDDIRKLWHARQGKRPSPVLLVIGYAEHGETRVSVCGPVGEQPPVIHGLEPSQVERLAGAALSEPSRHAAIRFLVAMLPEVGADLPGLRNSGLLATQELRNGVPLRHDWQAACQRSRTLLPLRGRQLVEKLGFGIEQLSVTSSVLTIGTGGKRAVAVFLDEGETFDEPADRFAATPVSHALALADREGVPWVVLTRARQIRLYAARADTGVGRKGRAETFVEIDLALLPEDRAGYVDLLFSAGALRESGTLDDILRQSADFAAELAIRLRERVYFEAVPGLATAIADRLHRDGELTEDDLAQAYEQRSSSCSASCSSPTPRTRTFSPTGPTAVTPTMRSRRSPGGSPRTAPTTRWSSTPAPSTCGKTSGSSGALSTRATAGGVFPATTAASSPTSATSALPAPHLPRSS